MYQSRPNWRLSHDTTRWVTPKGLRDAGVGVNGTAYDATTDRMVQIKTDPSRYIVNSDFKWAIGTIAASTQMGICLFRDRVIIPTANIRTVDSSTKYYPCIYIYDINGNLLNKFESSENFSSIGNSYTSMGVGEYECCYISIADSNSNAVLVGGFFRNRNIIALRSPVAYGTPIETKTYAMWYSQNNQNITVYYSANPGNNSIIDTWNTYQFSLPSGYIYSILGAYEQYIYVGNYGSNNVYGGGNIYRIDVSTKTYTLLTSFDTQSITNQQLIINPNDFFAIDYPYMYKRLYKYNSSDGYPKMIKINLQDGSTNLDSVISSQVSSYGVPDYRLLGHDAQYIYAYNWNSSQYYANEFIVYRIHKSTGNVETIPSLSLTDRNSFLKIPKQLFSQDYSNILYGIARIDCITLSMIPIMYSEGVSVYLTPSNSGYKDVTVSSRNTYYLGFNRLNSATSNKLIYNPNMSPYRYTDTVVIKE